jgi:hypothetical protein
MNREAGDGGVASFPHQGRNQPRADPALEQHGGSRGDLAVFEPLAQPFAQLRKACAIALGIDAPAFVFRQGSPVDIQVLSPLHPKTACSR